MWYNILNNLLLNKGLWKNDECPCLFIKKSNRGYCIISVYVDNLNIIRTTQDINEACSYLKNEFEMKDLGKTEFCLGLRLEHTHEWILLHQSNYTRKVLERFNMKDTYPLRSPIVIRSFDIKRIHLDQKKRMRNCWDLNIPILVLLEH